MPRVYCAEWGYIVAFSKILTMYQIYYIEFIPSTGLLYPPPTIPGMVATGIIFAFTYMYTHFNRV
jgi:hypothetical protein